MANDNVFLEKYLDYRFFHTYDIEGTNLPNKFLIDNQGIKNSSTYKLAEIINVKTSELVHLVSQENDDDYSAIVIEYQKLTDNINIPNKYKIEMYDLVINGAEKCHMSTDFIYKTLVKKANIISLEDSRAIQHLNLQASLLRLEKNKKQYLQNLIAHKITNKATSNHDNTSKKNISEENRKIFENNEKLINSGKLTALEKIDMLSQQMELCEKCGFKRSLIFAYKADACGKLSYLVGYEKAEEYIQEEKKWLRNLHYCRKFGRLSSNKDSNNR